MPLFAIPPMPDQQPTGVLTAEVIPGTVSESHSSTLEEAKDGSIVVTWYMGNGEQNSKIYVSRRKSGAWSQPKMVADDGSTCRNPVLFQPSTGPMLLYYHVGDPISTWKGYVKTSDDNGLTWSSSKQLPSGFLGPIKNKPVELADGSLLMGSSTEGGSNGLQWKVHMEKAPKGQYTGGSGWTKTPGLAMAPKAAEFGHIQPTILSHGGSKYQILARGGAASPNYPASSFSQDAGATWSALAPIAGTPDAIYTPTRGGTGFDGVTLTGHGLFLNRSRQIVDVFEGFTAYHCSKGGVWVEQRNHRIHNALLADNGIGVVSFDCYLTNSVILGESINDIGNLRELRSGNSGVGPRGGIHTVGGQGPPKAPMLHNVTFIDVLPAAISLGDYRVQRPAASSGIVLKNTAPLTILDQLGDVVRVATDDNVWQDLDGTLTGRNEPTLLHLKPFDGCPSIASGVFTLPTCPVSYKSYPLIQISSPADGQSVVPRQAVTFKVLNWNLSAGGKKVAYSIDEVEQQSITNAGAPLTLPDLAPGWHSIRLQLLDEKGNAAPVPGGTNAKPYGSAFVAFRVPGDASSVQPPRSVSTGDGPTLIPDFRSGSLRVRHHGMEYSVDGRRIPLGAPGALNARLPLREVE